MKHLHLPLLSIGFASSLILSGCLLSPVKEVPIQSFSLDSTLGQARLPATAPKSHPTTSRTPYVLVVKKPSASPGYGEKSMLYSDKAHRLSQFAKHQWIAPPTEMLWSRIIQQLSREKQYKAVIPSDQASLASDKVLLLAIDQVQLKQVFKNPQHAFVHFSFQAYLTKGLENTILLQKTFVIELPSPTPTPYGGVLAANAAITQGLSALTQALKRQNS